MLRIIRSIDIPKSSRVPFWQEEVCPYLYGVDLIGVSEEDFSFVWETQDIGAFGFAHMTADIRGATRPYRDQPGRLRRHRSATVGLWANHSRVCSTDDPIRRKRLDRTLA